MSYIFMTYPSKQTSQPMSAATVVANRPTPATAPAPASGCAGGGNLHLSRCGGVEKPWLLPFNSGERLIRLVFELRGSG